MPPEGGFACETRVELCAARCAVAEMDDHGPYIAWRSFDLSRTTKEVIGAGDTGPVRFRLLR